MTGGPERLPQAAAQSSGAAAQTTVLESIARQHLLDALDGVAYLTDPHGRILAVGQPSWQLFAADNAAPWLTADAVVGASLFEAIRGDDVRDAYQRMHDGVLTRRRSEAAFEFRCDSPIAERHMRMAITPVVVQDEVVAMLYQSQILAEVSRLPMPLFSSDLRAAAARPPPPDKLVTVCSFCQRVRWPPGPPQGTRRWISAPEFYRRGGPEDAMVSDGVCPQCLRRVVLPNT
jgi:hypothetical protein